MEKRRTARAGAGAFLVMALVVVACRSEPTPPRATGAEARPCPAGDPLAGVYHPDRLRVLETCVRYSGTIRNLKHESDGDFHLYVIPDRGMERFLDDRSRGFGDLIVELLPGQTLPVPEPGQRVVFFGTWAYDTDHDWNEIHPVWAERLSGTLHTGAPPVPPEYGGHSNA